MQYFIGKHLQRLTEELVDMKQLATSLKEQVDFFQTIIDTIPNPVYYKDVSLRYLGCNKALAELLGVRKEEIIGSTVPEVWPKEVAEHCGQIELEWINGKRTDVLTVETMLPHSNGSQRNFLCNEVVYFNVNQEIAGIVGVLVDITECKRTEQQLRGSQECYEALVRSLPAGLFQSTPEGGCVYTTGETSKMLGVPIEDILGHNWVNTLHPDDKERVVAEWRRIATKQESFNLEYRLIRPDGRVIWIKALANPYIGNDQKLWYVGTLTDITEAKEKEEELRISSERFGKTFAACPSAVCIVDLTDFKYIDANESWVTLTGYSNQEIIGRKFTEFKIWTDNSRIWKLKKIINECGAFYNEEVTLITKNGELRIGLTSAVTINLQGQNCVSIVMHDITEQKKIEKELNRLERLNLVGQMAAGIGHEVRNPMTTVKGLLQILGNKPECANYKEQFNLMISELDRANSIIAEYLSLAKKEVVCPQQININQIIETLYPLLMADALNSNKDIITLLKPTPDLMLNAKEIRQLVLNLVRNGLEAMPSKGELTISTYEEDDQVVLAVKDQGSGIAEDIIGKLGTPFLTTKAEGTGLGLATCYSIANRHGATISVDTGSHGTTFYVKFNVENM